MPAPPAYLDECVDQRVAEDLRRRGYTIVTALDAGMLGATDDAQLDFKTAHGLVIITHNRRHFQRLHAQRTSEGRPHGGIIVVPAASRLSRLTVRAAMLLTWFDVLGSHTSRLVRWGDLQYELTRGLHLPGVSEAEIRLAVGQTD